MRSRRPVRRGLTMVSNSNLKVNTNMTEHQLVDTPDGPMQADLAERYYGRKAADLARETNFERLREERREARRQRNVRWTRYAITILVPCVVLYGIWYFAIEPLVHYHSLSVACAGGYAGCL
jgi:hypothetical protein